MRRIASSIDYIKAHYDVVVVGSGYGGGISASRLARAGLKVCLLERGREIVPGEYPDTLVEAGEEMQFNAPEGHQGSRLGMFDFHVNEEQNALVGCGLGGTSLINAGVSLEPDPVVFENPRWPQAVREHRDTLLKEGMARAREMLKPVTLPENQPTPPKTEAHAKSGAALGGEFYRAPINVTFEEPEGGINHAGVPQKACNYCGDCVSGCNHQAKNTTLMNYLPDAWNHGADIFCEVNVRHVSRGSDGWMVHYQLVDKGRDSFDAPTLFVRADNVVLAAGTLGSTEILLRSREKGLALSDQLGMNFTGNGDMLGFGYNCDQTVNGIGYGARKPGQIPPVGPSITSIIDLRQGEDPSKHMVIEEGAIPGALARIIPSVMSTTNKSIGEETDKGIWDTTKGKARELVTALRGPYHGATHHLQTYLIMGHDNGAGRLELKDDRVRIVWPNEDGQPNVAEGNARLRDAAEALGGDFIKNPVWTDILRHNQITIHPLGGCVMGEDAGLGVVNHKGQVFSGANGVDVHGGLYVSDGAVIPTSLAINPLLTISALAERCCMLMAQDNGWAIDYRLPSKPTREVEARKLGIRFTETMKGFFSGTYEDAADLAVYENAAQAGKAAGSTMAFTLTITSGDLDTMLELPDHHARIVGTVDAPALSEQPLTVTNGAFNLFKLSPETPGTRQMIYQMTLSSKEGKTYWFNGYKLIHNDPDASEIWRENTTLYITIHEGDGASGPLVGKGVMQLQPTDFARQMTTMTVINAQDTAERLRALVRFGEFFAGALWQTYGGIFAKPTLFNPDAPPRKKRPLRVDAPEVHFFKTEDDANLRLTRYHAGSKGPVMLVHGLGVASSIFSTDTIETNLLEFLFSHGYDVWLLDFRVSIELPASRQASDGDQIAKYDYPAAIAKIQEVTGARTVQSVVHCYGATTFFMSMLQGLKGVRSIVCSQIATNVVVPTAAKIKTGLHLPAFLDALGIKSLTAYVDSHADWLERIYDKAAAVSAMEEAQSWCDSPICHRISFLYAPLFRHGTLNNTLHENLHELFGVGNMRSFEHLALLCHKGTVVDFEGRDTYMPHVSRLKLPICFIHGEKNECYLPKSTEMTYNMLRSKFGGELYSRHLIPEYGHIDSIFGKNAVKDVYPHILAHLEKTAID